MIRLESPGTRLEGDEAGCGKHPRLPHAASEHLADRATALDEVARTENQRSDWGAQALAEAELDRVEVPRHVRHFFLQGGCRIEHACAVEMNVNALLMRAVADLVGNSGGKHGAAGHVGGVLEADEARLRAVVDLRPNRP